MHSSKVSAPMTPNASRVSMLGRCADARRSSGLEGEISVEGEVEGSDRLHPVQSHLRVSERRMSQVCSGPKEVVNLMKASTIV